MNAVPEVIFRKVRTVIADSLSAEEADTDMRIQQEGERKAERRGPRR